MRNSLRILSLVASLLGFAFLSPALALAQSNYGTAAAHVSATATTSVTGSTKASAAVSAKLTASKSRGDQEITRRITALTDLNLRIQEMQQVPSTYKQSLAAAVQQLISGFTSLKAKIDADTDAATLKTDIQTITQSYRVFALVIPQARIAAASDRIVTIASMMNMLGAKLQARVQTAQTGGADVSLMTKALADMKAKITDAQTQAQAAFQHTSALVPDNGDAAKMKSNTAALTQARSDIQVGHKDIVAARKDVDAILKGLKGSKANSSTSASASSTTSGH